MDKEKKPSRRDGKICYLEIPAINVGISSSFYQKVFGWNIRTRSDGQTAFDDTTGEVSGTWITGRKTSGNPGILIYIMVDKIENTVKAIVDHGGTIVQEVGVDAPEITARFSDPAGNILGLYQEPISAGTTN